MRFGVLGALAVWTPAGEPVRVPEAKVRLLLADLLAHGGRPVPVDRLVFDLWGDRPPGNPVNTLQTKVSQLRRVLGPLVVREPTGYAVRVGAGSLDLLRFRELVAGGRYAEALGLWRGEPLAEFADAPFVPGVVAAWEEERLAAVERLAEVAPGGVDLAAEVARYPLRERLRGLHMRALYRAGRQVEALESYAELRALLAEERGLEPGPELAALHLAILRQDPALGSGPVPYANPTPGSATPDHDPASGHDPAPGSGRAVERSRTNLPAAVTALVGRDAAVRGLRDLLGRVRLVTLTGPGGVGKTSLAVEVARGSGAPDGVWLVELAGAGDGEQVVAAVAAVLGVRDDGGGRFGDPVDRVVDALRTRDALLVLDNCERLVEPVAGLVSRLLRAAPRLRVLVTSQEPLALAAEVVWAVPPLDLPGAVELFAARAAAAAPGFAVTGENAPLVEAVCRRLDGLPLALELAATRVRGLGLPTLLDRLRDRFRVLAGGHRDAPARHRTLRAVIDWSWDLLDDTERAVLRRLSAHVDGCALDAAEAVCAGGGVAAADVPDVLTRLVDRSLVVAPEHTGTPRFRLLESVADYGRERLREAGELEDVRRRHAEFYLALAERADPELRGPDQLRWLERLDADAANLRAAFDAVPDPARLARALTCYWFLRGRLREALRLLTGDDPVTVAWRAALGVLAGEAVDPAAVARAAEIEDPGERARARWFLGYVLATVGDMARGEELTRQALAAFEELGDRWGVAAAHADLVNHLPARGLVDQARESAALSAALFTEVGDRWGLLKASFALGVLAQMDGDYARSAAVHREGLRVAEELRSWPEVSYKLSWLGRVALLTGDLAEARDLHERARRIAVEHGFPPGEVYAETGLALGARREGLLDEAEERFGRVLAWHRKVGGDLAATLPLAELGFVAELRGEVDRALELQAEGLALARTSGDPRAVALGLEGMAGARAAGGEAAEAARLLGAAAAARDSVGVPLPPGERGDVDRITAAVREVLGAEGFAAAFEAGYAGGEPAERT
ncbi:AfsR/SARP family transcriptional regulator [Saccharothrix syringae]|uniref:AfsR/SARP family transcriptional regulator n=1 Tax=Saccharothrix syringae TaxID=103733 RepID=A0A5Q0HC83_SACSY|nr:BTAD domain-containing putative transcriptional regulator [Saccharothrix syringae]QFZ23420.1 AfsR/SARP family transcriptional regulator [Saccharothrix syringae]